MQYRNNIKEHTPSTPVQEQYELLSVTDPVMVLALHWQEAERFVGVSVMLSSSSCMSYWSNVTGCSGSGGRNILAGLQCQRPVSIPVYFIYVYNKLTQSLDQTVSLTKPLWMLAGHCRNQNKSTGLLQRDGQYSSSYQADTVEVRLHDSFRSQFITHKRQQIALQPYSSVQQTANIIYTHREGCPIPYWSS